MAAAVVAGLQAAAPPPPRTTLVLTAARDLPAGSRIAADDLVGVEFRPESTPRGTVERTEAVGRLLASPLRAGEPVTDVRLVAPSLLDGYPGRVAVPVRLPDAAVVDLLEVGDTIDVLVASSGSTTGSGADLGADPGTGGTAARVITDTPVIAIPTPDQAQSGLPGRLIVVAATPSEGQRVADAAAQGYLTVTISR